MDWDELKPKPPKAVTVGEDLKTLSVAELEARIVTFTAEIEPVGIKVFGEDLAEIERVRAELQAKKAHEAAAAALFKR